MKVARLLYPVEVLGPGRRIAIWLSGCPHGCKGCANPELWVSRNNQEISFEAICQMIELIRKEYEIDGFTITGGEPFFQPEDLRKLVTYFSTISKDILVYSGYQLEALQAMHSKEVDAVLNEAAVLIDDVYTEEQNKGHPLKGSENQTIHYLQPDVQHTYEEYIKEAYGKHRVQNFPSKDGIISVGIHSVGFQDNIRSQLQERGIHKIEGIRVNQHE